MPAIGCPSSGTPRSGSAATAPGISPSPQALSITPLAGLDDADVEAGPGGVQRGGQADRAAAGDEQVTHRRAARGSVRERGVLDPDPHRQQDGVERRVKTTAVTQAACTSGSATPSTTTAT